MDAAVATVIERFGGIDICIANAGVVSLSFFWTMSEETWALINDIDLAGVLRTAKAAAPRTIDRRSGSIVMIASIDALDAGPAIAHYTAAKHGVLGRMRAIALELPQYGVRCNAVCPRAVDSKMTNNQFFLRSICRPPRRNPRRPRASGDHVRRAPGDRHDGARGDLRGGLLVRYVVAGDRDLPAG